MSVISEMVGFIGEHGRNGGKNDCKLCLADRACPDECCDCKRDCYE